VCRPEDARGRGRRAWSIGGRWAAGPPTRRLKGGTHESLDAFVPRGRDDPAIVVGGFVGWPYYGYAPFYGFGPYWGPYYPAYGPWGFAGRYYPGGFDSGRAAAAGLGAVDLHAKPGDAEVWVDGTYVNEARDLDGNPGFLWLREGPHHVVVYRGGYRSFDETVAVQPGQKLDLKVRLEKGDSLPPGTRPGAATHGG
jgi:PEGA domain-containing protein